MSRPLVLRPSNRFVVADRDRRWAQALGTLLVLAAAVAGLLFLAGWPRLQATAIHYQLLGLRSQVAELERREHTLSLELERRRSPAELAERARRLGLAPPSADHLQPLDEGSSP